MIESENSVLVRINEANRALERIQTIDEAKEVRDRAEALRGYAKQVGACQALQNRVVELKIRAERRAGELLKEVPKHRGGRRSTGNTMLPVRFKLSDVGVTKMQSSRWQSLADIPQTKFDGFIADVIVQDGELTSTGLYRLARKLNRPTHASAPLDAEGRYSVVLCDPPWRYEHCRTENRAIENQYPTMALEEICSLPVNTVIADDAILFLWATSPKLGEAMQVLEAWGFSHRTAMAWVKDKIGMGYYVRSQHEQILIATRGKISPPAEEDRPPSVFHVPRRRHSEKPERAYELIEQMYPEHGKLGSAQE